MLIFNKKQESIDVLTSLDDKIFEDFLYFYDMECMLHAENKEKSPQYNDNPCENLGTINPGALTGEDAQKRISYFFEAKSPLYGTGARVRNFVASCIIKYGSETIKEYKERCLASLSEYGVPAQVVRAYQKRYTAFWTYPLFIRAYFHFQYIRLKKHAK